MSRVVINSCVGECGSWDVRRWCVEGGRAAGLCCFYGKSGEGTQLSQSHALESAKPVSTGRHNTNSTSALAQTRIFCLVR